MAERSAVKRSIVKIEETALTQRCRVVPSQRFLDHSVDIWQLFAIIYGRQSARANDLVEFRLRLALDIGIEDHRADEGKRCSKDGVHSTCEVWSAIYSERGAYERTSIQRPNSNLHVMFHIYLLFARFIIVRLFLPRCQEAGNQRRRRRASSEFSLDFVQRKGDHIAELPPDAGRERVK